MNCPKEDWPEAWEAFQDSLSKTERGEEGWEDFLDGWIHAMEYDGE